MLVALLLGASGCVELVGRVPPPDGAVGGDANPPPADVNLPADCQTPRASSSGVKDDTRSEDQSAGGDLREWGATADRQGRIVITGLRISTDVRAIAMRYLPDGTRDMSFGTGGVTLLGMPGQSVAFNDATIDERGRIVAVGRSCAASDCVGLVARFNDDGALDTSFAGRGWVTLQSARRGPSVFRSVAVRGDSIIAAGSDADSYGVPTLGIAALYRSDGSLDPAFASNGVYIDTSRWLRTVLARPEGYLFAGTDRAEHQPTMVLLGPNGVPVRTFGQGGSVVLPDLYGEGFGLRADLRGGILLAMIVLAPGANLAPGGGTLSIARFNADGSLDSAYANRGILALPLTASRAYSMAPPHTLDCDGAMLVSGVPPPGDGAPRLLRFDRSGAPDRTFGDRGAVQLRGVAGAPATGCAGIVVSERDATIVTLLGSSRNDMVAFRYVSR